MKTRLLLLPFLVLLAASCCLVTSQDCNCEPPSPELIPELAAWMQVYEQSPVVTLENSSGETDSLLIGFEADTEYCGGDECGANCERQTATLLFQNAPLEIVAQENDNLLIRLPDEAVLPFADFSVFTALLWIDPDFTGAYRTDYPFSNETLEVIRLDCQQCDGQLWQSLTVSKTRGLIELTDAAGVQWKSL